MATTHRHALEVFRSSGIEDGREISPADIEPHGRLGEKAGLHVVPGLLILGGSCNVIIGMRCLLVEDEKRVADAVARGLREERFTMDVAYNGGDGWRLASTYDYDLIILDLMLPGISGSELLNRTRREKPKTPILILTALDSTRDKVEHFEAGADDYLTKPFEFAELLVRAKALVRRGTASGSVLRIADLELDRLTQQVRRAGTRIELTAKEYGLLEYLLANAGRVLSRSMIVEHVWDESFHGLTNIVEVYVRHLRSKVDDPFARKLIRTVRGAGYCISDDPT